MVYRLTPDCKVPNSYQAAHYHSRKKMSTRWDPQNVYGLCSGCHFYLHVNPAKWPQVLLDSQRLTQRELELLDLRANTPARGMDYMGHLIEVTQWLYDVSLPYPRLAYPFLEEIYEKTAAARQRLSEKT
jgi:hypothetical protein